MSGSTQEHRRLLDWEEKASGRQKEWTLVDLLLILRRRRGIVICCLLAAVGMAAVYCILTTPHYRAAGQVEVQKVSPDMLGLDRNISDDGENSASDALDSSMTLETEANILQSSALALMVVKDLNLETTEDYFPARKRGFQLPAWMYFWRKPVEPMSVPLERAPNRRFAVLKIFASHLKVKPVAGTRLIDVSYSSPDPKLASAVVNRLIEAMQEFAFQSRFQATAQASTWLSGQLASLKKQTESLQNTAGRLEQGTGIYGDDTTHNLLLARLEELNNALSTAESNRILKQAVYEVAKSGDPELISGLAGNSMTGANPAMANSLGLLQTLRAQEAQVQAEIDEDDERYGSAYPKVTELHAELDGIEDSIRKEIARIGERAHTDYEIAARAEDEAKNSFEKQEQLASEANDRTAAYELAKQDADSSRNLYDGLQEKLKAAGVLEGLRSTNLTVVNAGLVPPTNKPSSPNVPLYLAAAVAGGLFLGCACALVREATDRTVCSIDELERMLRISLVGVVPELESGGRFRILRRQGRTSKTRFESGARDLRRSLMVPLRGPSSQSILIASAVPADGKSRIAASLAWSLARSGAQVLLVDADLFCPALGSYFGVAQGSGLTEALMDGAIPQVHACEGVPKLSLVYGGQAGVENRWDAANLFSSERMEDLMNSWRTQYDYVLLDSAPVLPVPAAATLARLCDRTLLVVRYESTTRHAAQRGYAMIQGHMPEQARLDVVMNGVPKNSPDYVAYYGYKGSTHKWSMRGYA